jgi:hypothetical protein
VEAAVKSEAQMLLEKLSAIVNQSAEQIPEGWKTVREWSALWGKARSQTERFLKAGVEAGVMETRKFRGVADKGRVMIVSYYREKV